MKRLQYFSLRRCMLISILSTSALTASAQSGMPLGSWRMHLSFDSIQHIEAAPDYIFAAAKSGVLAYNLEEQSLHTFHKLNGLSNTGISALKYDVSRNQLLVGYEDGDVDIIHNNIVTNFSRLRDAEITVSKKINHIAIHQGMAYLSTAYGVVVLDLQQLAIKETWRDLGVAGQPLAVFQTTFLNDSVYAASADGVLAGDIHDNLLDFNNWNRFNAGSLSGPVDLITTFKNKVYAAAPQGLYRFGGNNWSAEPALATASIKSLSSSDGNLYIIEDSRLWSWDGTAGLSEISDPLIPTPVVAKADANGNLWIGDASAGLVSDTNGVFSAYLPDGPSLNVADRLVFLEGSIIALAGGIDKTGQPTHLPGHINAFENGSWNTTVLPDSNLTDVLAWNGNMYFASFGSGVAVAGAVGNITYWDETNSPLEHIETGGSRITALARSEAGLWVANYGGASPLHLLTTNGAWESFDFGLPNERHPTGLSIDGQGNVWMALDPATGGGLIAYDPDRGTAFYKGAVTEPGALPHADVYCTVTDRDGYTWVGTGAGVAWFLSASDDAIKPVFENRFLLRDEKITALAVDAGNRKWIGTEEGVWLFNATGEELVLRFAAENSPLLSNHIHDIAIDGKTGEVFFATDRGIISYRSDAVDAAADFEKRIKIFPNPVRPNYSGVVGISGLAQDAIVKITDVSGNLVWQTQAHGGMATWHVRNHQGNRVATGVYLVFATTTDGAESVVGKVAVVE